MLRSDSDIAHFLSSPLVSSLLSTHPNSFAASGFLVPLQWASWWHWAAAPASIPRWLSLVDSAPPSIPIDLQTLIRDATRLQLDRLPSHIPAAPPGHHPHGMSPKKSHEVSRMSDYIAHLLASSPLLSSVRHVVDVGAGQGYISSALKDDLGLHVLALDSNEAQTSGAERKAAARQRRNNKRTRQDAPAIAQGSVLHKTVHITQDTLRSSVDEWMLHDASGPDSSPDRFDPLPVLFVALHACGSLTPVILRTFISCRRDKPHQWTPVALVVVGCCYNLLSPDGMIMPFLPVSSATKSSTDFPLSRTLSTSPSTPRLSLAHLHLAAQIPSQWLSTPSTLSAASLAIRKVVYRALLQPLLQLQNWPTAGTHDELAKATGETPASRRLGKLPDAAYADWETFLARAAERMGVRSWDAAHTVGTEREGGLEVLHVLRCLLGPVVETLLIRDRCAWVREEMGEEMDAGLVNLFDQATGSGRNVAIVISPKGTLNRCVL